MFTLTIYILILLLVPIHIIAEIEILGEGVGYIAEDDIAMIFYVTVKNICHDDLELSINMIQCCESFGPDDVDCNSMTLIGGDMGVLPATYIKNLTLIWPNIYLFNRQGICSVEITYRNQLKKKEIITEIHFDSSKDCPKTSACETIDLDFKTNCNPVDCLIKYSGTTSYYNPECMRCQKVPTCDSKLEGCTPDIAYSPYSNECINLNEPITKQDLENIGKTRPGHSSPPIINAICHYGKVTKNGECLCNEGWISATSDEGLYEPSVAQHHLCNIQVGDWNSINSGRLKITTILIAIFALTIISKIILLMCLMTWCYKHFRKTKKTCAQELDPTDKSVILCNSRESFEKCLCCELENEQIEQADGKQNPRELQSQTVNVAYYPGSASVFSSLKTSSASSRMSARTQQSIDLSHTTSSIPISFEEESSEESENTNETLFCDDDENNIAYGVYCGVENEEEEEEEEDDEEEDEEEEVDEEENLEEADVSARVSKDVYFSE